MDGKGTWTRRRRAGEPESVSPHLEEAPARLCRAGLKVSEGCFRGAARTRERRRRENDPEHSKAAHP